MTILHCIGCLILGLATLFSTTVHAAEDACLPTPEKYRHLEFGHVRFAIEEGCPRTLTQNEQFFVAGVAQTLFDRCKLPKDRQGRAMVNRFTKASALALALRKPEGPLHDTITPQADSAAAFSAGRSMVEEIACNGPEAALLSRGIVIYLKRNGEQSRFVAGCTEFYQGRYSEKQCQCIASHLRTVLPDVDQRYFDREIIRESIHHSPFIAFRLIFSCGIGNY